MLLLCAAMIEEPEERLRFENIYYSYRKQMLMVARKVLPDPWDAEDAMQAALFGIAMRIRSIRTDDPDMLRAYVLLASKNAAIDLKRRQERQPLQAEVEADALPDIGQAALFDHVAASMEYERLLSAMEVLEAPYREVLFLCCVHQHSPTEAAEILCRKPGTVRQQLRRGKAMLVELCRKEGISFE